MPHSIRRPHAATVSASALGFVLVLVCASCADDAAGPAAPPNATIELIYDVQGRGTRLSQPDRIHVIVLRTTGAIAADTTLPFLPGVTDAHFRVALYVQSAAEAFDVTTELLEGTLVVARGSRRGRDL